MCSVSQTITDSLLRSRSVSIARGKITDVERRTATGLARGSVTMRGSGSYGSEMQVDFQNENLVARVDDHAVAMVPDLICIVAADDAEPITTEMLRYGQRVAVIGIPCHPMLSTPEALCGRRTPRNGLATTSTLSPFNRAPNSRGRPSPNKNGHAANPARARLAARPGFCSDCLHNPPRPAEVSRTLRSAPGPVRCAPQSILNERCSAPPNLFASRP
jgi:hypothetical protein